MGILTILTKVCYGQADNIKLFLKHQGFRELLKLKSEAMKCEGILDIFSKLVGTLIDSSDL